MNAGRSLRERSVDVASRPICCSGQASGPGAGAIQSVAPASPSRAVAFCPHVVPAKHPREAARCTDGTRKTQWDTPHGEAVAHNSPGSRSAPWVGKREPPRQPRRARRGCIRALSRCPPLMKPLRGMRPLRASLPGVRCATPGFEMRPGGVGRYRCGPDRMLPGNRMRARSRWGKLVLAPGGHAGPDGVRPG
jgi:hypothetical protein